MNWKTKTLGEIYDLEGGKVQTGPFGSQLHESDYKEFGIPVIMPKDIIKDKLDTSSIARISKEDANRLSKHLVITNDIIFPRRGEINKRVLIKEENSGAFCGTGCIRLRGTGTILNPLFLFYYLKQKSIVKWIENQSVGATMMNLNTSILKSIPILYPSLQTQNKITSILSAYDDLIDNNHQRIQLLEEMAEDIYKEWFVRMRFPGYQDCKYFDKEGKEVEWGTDGALPEGWEVKNFRNCLSHYIGGGWGQEVSKGRNIVPAHVLRGTDIPKFNVGQLNFDVLRFHTESNLSSRICEPNDIIFEVSGGTEEQSLGRTAFMIKSALDRFDAPVIGASFCKLLRVNSKIISPFIINGLLNRMHSTNELKVFQVQSTGISNYQFEDFIDATKIVIPKKSIQNQFEKLVAPMIDKIQLLGAKNQLLQETRDLLLPRLISGKLSVADIDIAT